MDEDAVYCGFAHRKVPPLAEFSVESRAVCAKHVATCLRGFAVGDKVTVKYLPQTRSKADYPNV